MDRLAAMEAFVRVVETGSFSLAARQLHLGQPAVSRMVAQIEERLGVQLLLRSTQGLFPTAAGQSFYERAKRVASKKRMRRRPPPATRMRASRVSCASPPRSRLPDCTDGALTER